MMSLNDSNDSMSVSHRSKPAVYVVFLFFFFCFVIKKVRVNLLRNFWFIPQLKSKRKTFRKYVLQKENIGKILGTSRFKLTIKKTNLHALYIIKTNY